MKSPPPEPPSEAVRKRLQRQRVRDTGPELHLRAALHARGLRYRVNLRVGRARPDVVFTRVRLAVFVMGDFWHSCPTHATRPKSNAAWWGEKLARNVERDNRQRQELEQAGWTVVWVWECEDVQQAADGIQAQWESLRWA